MLTLKKLITSRQVASTLQIHHASVTRLARSGKLPYAVKLPGRTSPYLFDAALIDAIAGHLEDETTEDKLIALEAGDGIEAAS